MNLRIDLRRGVPLLALLALLLAGGPAGAAGGRTDWDELSPETRQILAPVEERWSRLSAERQQRLLRGAQQWATLDEAQRAAARARMEEWQALSSRQRDRVRRMFAEYNRLDLEEQQRLRSRYEEFRSLPPEQQHALRERWQNMAPEERAATLRQRRFGGPEAIDEDLRMSLQRERRREMLDAMEQQQRRSVVDRMLERRGIGPAGPGQDSGPAAAGAASARER